MIKSWKTLPVFTQTLTVCISTIDYYSLCVLLLLLRAGDCVGWVTDLSVPAAA